MKINRPKEAAMVLTWRMRRFGYTCIVSSGASEYYCDFVSILSDLEIERHWKERRASWKHISTRPQLVLDIYEEASR